MFGQLRQQFDYVIIDCSPVLPVVDPLLVGVHADGVLLSVRPRVSQLPRIHEALERLTAARIPILGGVVNGVARSMYPPDYQYALPPQRQESQG
jgi:Mrp family chromosome partitioning ATPase